MNEMQNDGMGGVPFSADAERGLLSCAVQWPEEVLVQARGRVPVEAFYLEAHRLIWGRALVMMDARVPVEMLALTTALREAGELEQAGGAGAVSELWMAVGVPDHWEFYAGQVLDRWLLRRVMDAGARAIARAREFGRDDGARSAVEVASLAEAEMFDLVQGAAGGARSGMFVGAPVAVDEWLDHMERVIDNRGKVTGLTTGLHEVDLTLHGLDDAQGEILVLAGRPAMGKTAMAVTLMDHAAVEKGWPGLFFSAEMSKEQILTRMVLGRAGVDTMKGVNGYFSKADGEEKKMFEAAQAVRGAPLFINDASYITTADLRTQVGLAKRQHGIRWVLVDHLHLIKPVNPAAMRDERMKLVEVMETLQFIKKEYKVAVVLLVQMSRESDRNAGKPPVLADLAGSASIEQYADHVIFIHRPTEYVKWWRLSQDAQGAWTALIEPRRERSPELWSDGMRYGDEEGGFARQDYEEQAVLYVRKNRRGPTPELQVRYQAQLTRFTTRMPKLYSTHPLDQQLGTWAGGGGGGAGPTKKKGFQKLGGMDASGDKSFWENAGEEEG